MARTLAIVIGISKYQSKLFGTLPGADADARRVVQSLTSWGIHPENIRILLDQEATRQAILRALRVWPLQKASKDIRILVFFAGHGSRVQEPDRPPCSVLLPYDTDP